MNNIYTNYIINKPVRIDTVIITVSSQYLNGIDNSVIDLTYKNKTYKATYEEYVMCEYDSSLENSRLLGAFYVRIHLDDLIGENNYIIEDIKVKRGNKRIESPLISLQKAEKVAYEIALGNKDILLDFNDDSLWDLYSFKNAIQLSDMPDIIKKGTNYLFYAKLALEIEKFNDKKETNERFINDKNAIHHILEDRDHSLSRNILYFNKSLECVNIFNGDVPEYIIIAALNSLFQKYRKSYIDKLARTIIYGYNYDDYLDDVSRILRLPNISLTENIENFAYKITREDFAYKITRKDIDISE